MIVDVPGIPLRRRTGEIAYALVDPDDFVWLNNYRWTFISRWYAGRNDGGIQRYMHRELFGLEYGDRRVVDHINGDRLDNRRTNLRIVTQAQNCQNQVTARGTSRYRGVSWDKARGAWRVNVFVAGRQNFGGYFEDEENAGRAAVALRRDLMPFANETRAA